MKFFQNLVWVAIFSLSGTVAAQTPVYLDEADGRPNRGCSVENDARRKSGIVPRTIQIQFTGSASFGIARKLDDRRASWSSCRGHLGRMGPSRVDERFLYGIPGIDLFGSDLGS